METLVGQTHDLTHKQKNEGRMACHLSIVELVQLAPSVAFSRSVQKHKAVQRLYKLQQKTIQASAASNIRE